jgi:hypothetical protein
MKQLHIGNKYAAIILKLLLSSGEKSGASSASQSKGPYRDANKKSSSPHQSRLHSTLLCQHIGLVIELVQMYNDIPR